MKLPTSYLMTYLTANAEQFAASYLSTDLSSPCFAFLPMYWSLQSPSQSAPAHPSLRVSLSSIPFPSASHINSPPLCPDSSITHGAGTRTDQRRPEANRLCFPRQEPLVYPRHHRRGQMPNVKFHPSISRIPSLQKEKKKRADEQPQWNHPLPPPAHFHPPASHAVSEENTNPPTADNTPDDENTPSHSYPPTQQ